MTCIFFSNRVKTQTNLTQGTFMDNKVLAEMIREKYNEEKMSAEFKLQLNKVVEMEDKFLKNFSKRQMERISIFSHRKRSTPLYRS